MKTTHNNGSGKIVAQVALFSGICYSPDEKQNTRHILSVAGRFDQTANTLEILFMYGDAAYSAALSYQPGGRVMRYAKQYMFSFYEGSQQTQLVPFVMYIAKDINKDGSVKSIQINAAVYNNDAKAMVPYVIDETTALPGIVNAKDTKYRDSLNQFWGANIWEIKRFRMDASSSLVPEFARAIIPTRVDPQKQKPAATLFNSVANAIEPVQAQLDKKQRRKELKKLKKLQQKASDESEQSDGNTESAPVKPIRGASHTYDYRTLQYVNKLLYESGGRIVVNKETNELEIEIIDTEKANAIHESKLREENAVGNAYENPAVTNEEVDDTPWPTHRKVIIEEEDSSVEAVS